MSKAAFVPPLPRRRILAILDEIDGAFVGEAEAHLAGEAQGPVVIKGADQYRGAVTQVFELQRRCQPHVRMPVAAAKKPHETRESQRIAEWNPVPSQHVPYGRVSWKEKPASNSAALD